METKNHLWEVIEYCPGGSLIDVVAQDKALPEPTVKTFALEILEGLQYVHSRGVLLCNFKTQSILLNEYGQLKIADFGSARTF